MTLSFGVKVTRLWAFRANQVYGKATCEGRFKEQANHH